ncbi:MAG: TolC family protein [Gemmatimonadales bacterium]|jgi:outer membrane protein TolC
MSVQSKFAAVERRWTAMTRQCLLLAAAAATPAVGNAQSDSAQSDTLRVVHAVDLALSANPALQAARLRADGVRYQISQVGALPDPMLSFGLMNRPLDGFGTDEPMTMNSVQLAQRFPWPGKHGFAAERVEHLAVAQELDAQEVERQLIARVKRVYFGLAYMDRALAVMRDTRGLLRDFHDVSLARYAVGDGLQQDVLQAQVAVARMTEDITVMEQERTAFAARLNALLGRDATVRVPALELFGPSGTVAAVDSLLALAVGNRPALQAARARVAAADAGARAARRQLYPDLTVTLGYGQRPQYVDMVTVMLGVSIPLWAGSRQLPLRREWEARQAEQEARERSLYNETFARITELRAHAERAGSLATLYSTSVLPQARAAVESALSAYRVGNVDYMTLLDNQLTVHRYEIETLRLASDYQRAVAELEALVGGDFGGGQ